MNTEILTSAPYTCKATDWVVIVDDPERVAFLDVKHLPRYQASWLWGQRAHSATPCTSFDVSAAVSEQYFLLDISGMTFLVDTQGFDYCRYAVAVRF